MADLTQFRFSSSSCQVDGQVVPVADLDLATGDAVFFEPRLLLWRDNQVSLEPLPMKNAATRRWSGMPFMLMVARGPGRLACSHNAPGQLVVLPMAASTGIDVREHTFVLGSSQLRYGYVPFAGTGQYGQAYAGDSTGFWLDRFATGETAGLLVLHGNGNVFERHLADGEKLAIRPGGFLYKDHSVASEVVSHQIKTGWGKRWMMLLELTGPGRVGIQSMYVDHPSG